MFHRKYKIKTSTTVKGSERKRLRGLLESAYPRLKPEDLNQLISSKSDVTQTKGMSHSGVVFLIYCAGNTPLFFQVENRIYPTVYTLWKFPNLLPTLPIVPMVLEKFMNGADLMAPGIIVTETSRDEFKNLQPNDICAVRLMGNMSPIAVGTAVLSESEICQEGRKGKAVLIAHCYRDTLWESGDQIHPPIVPDTLSQELNIDSDSATEASETMQNVPVDTNIGENELIPDVSVLTVLESGQDSETTLNENVITESINYSMDDILKQCFMLALKTNGKKIQLPVLTSTFYRTYVLTCCPSDLNLDIKKTTYKKLSIFLKSMMKESLIQVKELTKGVESIVSINLQHESLLSFRPDPKFKQHLKLQKEEAALEESPLQTVQENFKFPEITEMFVVSGQVKEIFEKLKIKKGEALTSKMVRDAIKLYVQENGLQSNDDPRTVILDPVLTHSLLKSNDPRTNLRWDELFEILTSRMSPAYQISFDGEEPKLKKGNVEPIDISVATRSGNKKVTLINNLQNFGISPEKLASHVQVAVAASTSVGQAAGGKGTQVLIQGNQLKYLQTLLFDTYKVPRKYVRGLENISAKKK